MSVRSYRDLKVWQQGIDLIPRVYETLQSFPKVEQYALANQIRRAAVSVPANIAEGNARHHRKEYLRSLYIARGSLAELETLLIVAQRLDYLNAHQLETLNQDIRQLQRTLQGLIRSLTPDP